MTVSKVVTQRPFVEIAAPHPLWTASITGTNGDLAEIWVWTPTATLRTNIPVPVELRFRDKTLLLQVRSTQNRDMALDVTGKDRGSAHGRLPAGASNTFDFQAYERIPFLPIGGFSCGSAPQATFWIRPVFAKFPFTHPSGYDVVTNAVTSP